MRIKIRWPLLRSFQSLKITEYVKELGIKGTMNRVQWKIGRLRRFVLHRERRWIKKQNLKRSLYSIKTLRQVFISQQLQTQNHQKFVAQLMEVNLDRQMLTRIIWCQSWRVCLKRIKNSRKPWRAPSFDTLCL